MVAKRRRTARARRARRACPKRRHEPGEMSPVHTIGVLLAGGLARRMGGGDKPLRLIAGRTLLDRVIERLRPQVAGLVLNANGDPARFAAYGLPVVADSVS